MTFPITGMDDTYARKMLYSITGSLSYRTYYGSLCRASHLTYKRVSQGDTLIGRAFGTIL